MGLSINTLNVAKVVFVLSIIWGLLNQNQDSTAVFILMIGISMIIAWDLLFAYLAVSTIGGFMLIVTEQQMSIPWLVGLLVILISAVVIVTMKKEKNNKVVTSTIIHRCH